MEHVRTAGVPHASLLEAYRFCLFRSPASGSYPLIPIFEPVTCKYFNDLSLHSNANNKVIDTQYTFVLFFRVFMRIRQRMRILSDHRESKDSSPAPLFALSLHKERFTTLLESIASALFLKTAGCIPTIPIPELSAHTNRR